MFSSDISYSLYCTHLLTFSFVGWTVRNLAISPVGHAWIYIYIYMAAMLATGLVVAAGTYLMFEKPTTNFLKQLIKRPRLPANRKYSTIRQILGQRPAHNALLPEV